MKTAGVHLGSMFFLHPSMTMSRSLLTQLLASEMIKFVSINNPASLQSSVVDLCQLAENMCQKTKLTFGLQERPL